MDGFIERRALWKKIALIQERRERDGQLLLAKAIDLVIRLVENFPAADVAPVVHGKWKIVNVSNVTDGKGVPAKVVHCSNCGFTWSNIAVALKHFKGCPNCLARMDGE